MSLNIDTLVLLLTQVHSLVCTLNDVLQSHLQVQEVVIFCLLNLIVVSVFLLASLNSRVWQDM